jgi:hypothetical protein
VASLPCYTEQNVDAQRGKGVFEQSIEALQQLNKLGYGTGSLPLHLVYNPGGPFLPPPQEALQRDYKTQLGDVYGIEFMTSVFDIDRFKWCEQLNMKTYKIASRTVARYGLNKADTH